MPITDRIVQVRTYNKPLLDIAVELPLESYFPGDTILGTISVRNQDGTLFQDTPSFSYSVDFGQDQVLQETDQIISIEG